jgi:Lipid-A-disaccharide synthetase
MQQFIDTTPPLSDAALQSPELVLAVNGPGELYTWALPMARALRSIQPDLRIVLSLLPCPFASGQEENVARDSRLFDGITTVAQYLKFAVGGAQPSAYSGSKMGLVLQLGGDAMHAIRIAGRLNYPVWRYSFEPYWNPKLEQLFVHDQRTLQRSSAPKDKLEMIGNLTADALAFEAKIEKQQGLDILLLAGSRGFEALHMLPLFAACAEKIAAQVKDVRFHWIRSNMLDATMLARAYAAKEMLEYGGVSTQPDGQFLMTQNGTRIRIVEESQRYAYMKLADLALTIPGTNTLELGIVGVPSIVALPLQKLELIPIEGPLQFVGMIPWLGTFIKRAAVNAFLERTPFISLPNRFANEAIQLELRGLINSDDIATRAISLLQHPEARAHMIERLNTTMPKPGTADKLARRVIARLEQTLLEHKAPELSFEL